MELVDFDATKKLLVEYSISFPKTFFVVTEKEMEIACGVVKFPVFLKIQGKNILHRTDVGGVDKANNKKELTELFFKLMKIVGAEGILIQEEVLGKSLIVGMKRDAQFGPVIMVGIGGIFTEILKDFVLRVAPVSNEDALKMITELKGYGYLCGQRDKQPINFNEVAKIIAEISNLSIKHSEIKEIDLNPVISNEKKALAVDFKFLI
jgi:acyl-CoA synthetase (NDP forming)